MILFFVLLQLKDYKLEENWKNIDSIGFSLDPCNFFLLISAKHCNQPIMLQVADKAHHLSAPVL